MEDALRRVLLIRTTAVYQVLGVLDAIASTHSGAKVRATLSTLNNRN